MILDIGKDTETRIKNVIAETLPHEELEWRFSFSKISQTAKSSPFNTDMKPHIFDHLFSVLSERTTPVLENYTNFIYKDNIRKIVREDGAYIYQKKLRKNYYDVEWNKFSCRIVRSSEERVPDVNYGSRISSRKITRHRFEFEKYNVAMSQIVIDSSGQNTTVHEVEVELDKSRDLRVCILAMKDIAMIVFPDTRILFEKSSIPKIYVNYNTLLTKRINTFVSKGGRFDPTRGIFTKFERRPVNVKVDTDLTGYCTTNKLDGEGYKLFVGSDGIYLINSKHIEKISNSVVYENNKQNKGYILSGEYSDGVFGIFETYVYDGVDIADNRQLVSKLKCQGIIDLVNKIISSDDADYLARGNVVMSPFRVELKLFDFNNVNIGVKNIMKNLYNTYGEHLYAKNDGLIFTPIEGNGPIYKFKWLTSMSNDFLATGVDYEKYTFIPMVVGQRGVLQRFVNIEGVEELVYFNEESSKIVTENSIVECVYDYGNSRYVVYRARFDKEAPNFIDVTKDVDYDIRHPVMLDKLIENQSSREERKGEKVGTIRILPASWGKSTTHPDKRDVRNRERQRHEDSKKDYSEGRRGDRSKRDEECLSQLRQYSNVRKGDLITNIIKKNGLKIGLDLGFGRGGDIHKYSKAGVDKVYGIEPFEDNRLEALKRISEKVDSNTEFKVYPFKAQQTLDILNAVGEKVDFVASFFSLTFFYRTEEDIDKFCDTVSRNLKVGGKFICTYMDGQLTFDLLKGKSEYVKPGCFEIKKLYKDDDPRGFGQKISLQYENTIVLAQEEWLVWSDILDKKLESRGLVENKENRLVFSDGGKPRDMDDDEYLLYSRYVGKVYTRYETEKEQKTRERSEMEAKRRSEEEENVLDILEEDEEQDFDNSYGEEVQLVRYGSVGDGSCYFHSILKALDKKYRDLSEPKKRAFIKIFRDMVADSISMSQWKKMGGGNIAYLSFSIGASKLARKYKIENLEAESIDNFKAKLLEKVDPEVREDIEESLDDLEEELYLSFIERVRDCKAWVGQDEKSVNLFEYLSNLLNINVYIIKDSTRKPYNMGVKCEDAYKNRPSVIVLWVDETHYETIGLEGEKMLFSFDDPIIQRIHKLVCKD
jgi:hypothetical protein